MIRRVFFLAIPLAAMTAIGIQAARDRRVPTPTPEPTALLHNGWKVTPVGTAVALPGDMPGTIVPIPDTRFVAVNTCGYHNHSLSLVDTAAKTVVQRIQLVKDWVGMAYDPSRSTLYLSGGNDEDNRKKERAQAGSDDHTGAILRFKFAKGRLTPADPIELPDLPGKERFVSGILVDPKGVVFAANIQTDTVYRLSGADLSEITSAKVGYRPYGLALAPDGKTLAVSNWGDKSVSLLNPDTLQLKTKVEVGIHPNAVDYGPDERLFVANGGSNSVSVVQGDRVVETIRTSLDGDATLGTTPVGLAVANGRLYVANADDNDVAVVDVADPKRTRVVGFIPSGRYPCGVAVLNGSLLVATAKGLHDGPNTTEAQRVSGKPVEFGTEADFTYVGDLLEGHIHFVDLPSPAQLAEYTKQVRANRPLGAFAVLTSAERDDILQNALRKIHHVIYIIRENRTYDQVLGDVKAGNGDPRLTMFPARVTPNSHRLVGRYVLLDNCYCDGEVSQCGHQWTDAAYANDYCEKQWLLSYGDHGEVKSDARMFTSPGGYLWQNVKRHGKTARIYGEYLEWQEDHGSASGPVKEDPEAFGCSKAFEDVFARDGRDTEKVDVFLAEMLAAEKTGKWPNFMVVALNEDHTSGGSAGMNTPFACVGNNDWALGRLVEGVSRSKFWKDTAIFVIQDDAQDGPDHVDAHRTVGLVISPFTCRNGAVDSTMYSTSSMIRTMELILGLPPMSQYDAGATPMFASFTTKPDFSPYDSVKPNIDLNAVNPAKGEFARRSAKLDFSDLDRADPREFNAILWEMTRPGEPMPAPVVSHARR